MEKTKEIRQEKKSTTPGKKSDPSKIILIVVILLLLGAIGYLVFNGQQKQEVLAKQTERIQSDSIKIEQKVKELEEFKAKYQELYDKNTALGIESDSLKTKIAELEKDIKSLRRDKANYDRVVAKNQNLQRDFTAAKTLNDSLQAQITSLKLEAENLSRLNREKDDTLNVLREKNKDFAQKVALASLLHAENVKIAVFSHKGKEEKFVPIYKAKSVGKIKVTFNIADNPVAKHEDKEIFFRIVEPSGSTIFEGDKIFMVDGKEAFYTDKQTINFNNTKQQVTFLYNKGSNYKPGKYNIELFAEGHKIGETVLSLK
jgi:predicted RNase H-like nuclease (RuvC/YqgF family)